MTPVGRGTIVPAQPETPTLAAVRTLISRPTVKLLDARRRDPSGDGEKLYLLLKAFLAGRAGYVNSLQALRALLYFELYLRALLKSAVPLTRNG